MTGIKPDRVRKLFLGQPAPAAEGQHVLEGRGSEIGRWCVGAGKPLRVYVEKGGCSGMQYSMTFDEVREGDVVAECDGVNVVVDSFSIDFLKGAVVDHSDDLTGGGFKIRNPNAAHTCGCGRSFESSE